MTFCEIDVKIICDKSADQNRLRVYIKKECCSHRQYLHNLKACVTEIELKHANN